MNLKSFTQGFQKHWERISTDTLVAAGVILGLVGYFTYLAFASNMSEGGGDAIVHYRMARYAWKYPQLFLDMWGKPLLTFFSSPLAQLGFNSMKLFNIAIFAATAATGFMLFRKLKLSNGALFALVIFSAPMYFILVPSTMTEPLFGFMLLTGVYLFISGKYTAAIILISFLPFSRNEGFIIFPFYILALLIARQWKPLPWILTGHLVFGILGWISSGDMMWLVKQMPYLNGGTGGYQYPSGSFWHYPKLLPVLYGKFLYWTGIAGSVIILFRALFLRKRMDSLLFLLLVLPVVTYIAAHSWVYWKGTGGAAGLERIMAPLVPLVAAIGLYGLSVVYDNVKLQLKPILIVIFLFFLVSAIKLPFKRYHLPLPMGEHELVIEKVADWVKKEDPSRDLIYYYHPYIIHILGLDPYDYDHVRESLPRNESYQDNVPDGALIFWDTHFGPQEGQTPLEKLKQEESFLLLKQFPEDTINKDPGRFQVFVFRKANP